MTATGWWEEVAGNELAQGDVLAEVEVPRVPELPTDEADQAEIDVETADLDVTTPAR